MPGRLINPFMLEIAQLDQTGTLFFDPDAAGPLTSGYDEVYRETHTVASEDRVGTDARQEVPTFLIPAQMHSGPTPGQMMMLKQAVTGNLATSMVQALMHFDDLQDLGLIDEISGQPLIKVGDRLHAVHDMDGNLIQLIPTPPGLYIVQVVPIFGLGRSRNLLEVSFESRDAGQAVH